MDMRSTSINNLTFNTTLKKQFRNGYDLPVVGLANGQFLSIHIPALVCMFCGLVGAMIVIGASFLTRNRHRNRRGFFNWTKCERFVIYIGR